MVLAAGFAGALRTGALAFATGLPFTTALAGFFAALATGFAAAAGFFLAGLGLAATMLALLFLEPQRSRVIA